MHLYYDKDANCLIQKKEGSRLSATARRVTRTLSIFRDSRAFRGGWVTRRQRLSGEAERTASP